MQADKREYEVDMSQAARKAAMRPMTDEEYWQTAEKEGFIAINPGHVEKIEKALRTSEGEMFFSQFKVPIPPNAPTGEPSSYPVHALISPDNFLALMKHVPNEVALSVLHDEIGTSFTSYRNAKQLIYRYSNCQLTTAEEQSKQRVLILEAATERKCRSQSSAIAATLQIIRTKHPSLDLTEVMTHLDRNRATLPPQPARRRPFS